MDGGASIITFVTAGLQSIKIIHNACSTIKHWPETVGAVSTQLQRLEDVLQRFVPEGDTVPAALQDLIRQCTADLQRYAGQVQSLQAPNGASRGQKIWRRGKSVLNEGAVQRMARAMTDYGDQISLQLALLHRDDLRESSRYVATIATNQQDVAAGVQSTQGSIATLINTQEALKVTLIAQNVTQSTALGSIEEVVREEATAARQSLQDAVSSLQTGSSAQLEKMTTMLQELQQSLKGKRSEAEYDDEIFAVIDRLCGLIDAKPRVIASEEAKDVIDDIGALLDLVHRTQSGQSSVPHRSYGDKQGVGEDISTRDIKRVKGMLDSALEIQIQHIVKTLRPPQGSSIKSNRKRKILELQCGTLTINSVKRSRMNRTEDEGELEDFLFDIALMSRGHHRPAIFKTSLYQRKMAQGSFASIPHFVVNPIVPVGSPIFDVVKKGSVRDLERLIWDGKASLRDHDEYGASLLHYAAKALNVDMCRYLVNTGAELDVLAMDCGYNPRNDLDHGPYMTPLQASSSVFYTKEGKESNYSICKTMLSAGADPNPFPTQDDIYGHFNAALLLANAEHIRIVLDYGSPYVDVNTTDLNGLLPIHLLAQCFHGSYNAEAFSLLLQRGATIHARDPQGNTCLHHALVNSQGKIMQLNALVYLVENGADVLAANYEGSSVSDIAYDEFMLGGSRSKFGSASGDLWDALLARCEYNVNECRKGYPRRATYTGYYSRKNFNLLWKGFEARCPYYDAWWDTHTYYAPGDNESMYQEVTNKWGEVYVIAKRPEDLEHTDSEVPTNEGVEMNPSKEADISADH